MDAPREARIDLTRCKRCNKRPRGKMAKQDFERYAPYCSYHCEQWAALENAVRHNIRNRR